MIALLRDVHVSPVARFMKETIMNPLLQTTVRNTSGARRSFSFLGCHGRILEANEEYTQDGDLLAAVRTNQRKFNALSKALDSKAITIVQTPTAHLLVDAQLPVSEPVPEAAPRAVEATPSDIADTPSDIVDTPSDVDAEIADSPDIDAGDQSSD